MGKCFDGSIHCTCLFQRIIYLLEEPCRRLNTVLRLVVTSVERCERLEVVAHVALLKFFQKGNHSLIMSGFRRKSDLRGSNLTAKSTEVIAVCDVEEVDVLLPRLASLHMLATISRSRPGAYTSQGPLLVFGHPSCLSR